MKKEKKIKRNVTIDFILKNKSDMIKEIHILDSLSDPQNNIPEKTEMICKDFSERMLKKELLKNDIKIKRISIISEPDFFPYDISVCDYTFDYVYSDFVISRYFYSDIKQEELLKKEGIKNKEVKSVDPLLKDSARRLFKLKYNRMFSVKMKPNSEIIFQLEIKYKSFL